MGTEKVDYREVRETNLITLYSRAVQSRGRHPVLRDVYAEQLVDRLDYDFSRLRIPEGSAMQVALRARQFDTITTEFVRAHPDGVVLHLACGLDSRYLRTAPPETVDWFDVDFPDVTGLRERLFPEPGPNYHLIGSSVTDPAWLDRVPTDRPGLVVAEGLVMYLTEAEGLALLRRVAAHLAGAELAFDILTPWGARLGNLNPMLRRTGAGFRWGIADPADLARQLPGATLRSATPMFKLPGVEELPRAYRVATKAAALVPAFRRMASLVRLTVSPGGNRPRS
ncbi:O-methyltransferase involved in polyketide biosynthesis [Crossiella equi]|uniref:O-methyltransferase involved in polyketide biosynthesis n=1 Tax=Crossiella equi TaxID=130796 RepID=A0ABS5A581_9PSEU|nr:class I SAM-dependent methyltransferase [Crossiella equi]MBP2471399.1 O-methyltransferase involved in polyketide biosynthesis [Crossiella equi]